jgi:hypothetical protein
MQPVGYSPLTLAYGYLSRYTILYYTILYSVIFPALNNAIIRYKMKPMIALTQLLISRLVVAGRYKMLPPPFH